MGGAGGHMRHPHDLDEVENGKDIIALFRAIPAYLKSKEFQGGAGSSLKLDGSNNGLRIAYRDGRYQFVIDRGTKGFGDIAGIALNQLEKRFPPREKEDPETGEIQSTPHGMVGSSADLLNMMNGGLEAEHDKMLRVLIELGLLEEKDGRLIPNSSKYISIEFVERVKFDHPTDSNLGRANVIYYPYDFIAFHGLSQFFEATNSRTGAHRESPLTRGPHDGTAPGKPIPYDRAPLDHMVELVAPYAPEGFKVFAPISLKVAAEAGEEVTDENNEQAVGEAIEQLSENIEQVLNSNISIRTSSDPNYPPITKSLKGWLEDKNFVNFEEKPFITLTDEALQLYKNLFTGNKVNPFHKGLHKVLIDDQAPISAVVNDPEIANGECELQGKLYDCEKAIYGAIFFEAARRLGNAVKESLTSAVEEFGPAVSHEGVVIDAGMPFGNKKTGHAFKITGEFIVDSSGGAYATAASPAPPGLREDEESVDLEVIEDEDADPVGEFAGKRPPQTIALVPGAFKPPHKGHADMVRKYATGDGVQKADKVYVIISAPEMATRKLRDGTEVTAQHALDAWMQLYPEVANLPEVEFQMGSREMASPVTIAYEYIGDRSPLDLQAGDNIILGASKKDDDWKRWREAPKYIRPDLNLLAGKEYAVDPLKSTSNERAEVNLSAGDLRDLISDVVENPNNTKAKNQLAEYVPADKIDVLFSILGLPAPGSEEPLEEESGSGAAGGYSGPLGFTSAKPSRRKGKKKKSRKENVDLSMVDEIMALIMERGILQ